MKKIFGLLLLIAAIFASICIIRNFSWNLMDESPASPLNGAAENLTQSLVNGLLDRMSG